MLITRTKTYNLGPVALSYEVTHAHNDNPKPSAWWTLALAVTAIIKPENYAQ